MKLGGGGGGGGGGTLTVIPTQDIIIKRKADNYDITASMPPPVCPILIFGPVACPRGDRWCELRMTGSGVVLSSIPGR